MPGKRIEDRQVLRYKELRRKLSQETAATKAGLSVRTARRLDASEALPSQREPRQWRTRSDPFDAVWGAEVLPLLSRTPGLSATTIIEELQRRHPGEYGGGLLRTLQRRVRAWRASAGAERTVMFAQEHPPGRLGLSDFTDCNGLEVEVDGVRFDHRLYQFALSHSGWRHAEVVLGGESFAALAAGLQNALWMMGGVPEEHRTDSLSAAFNNLAEREELRTRYRWLCEHYGMRASRNNPGVSHENGSIESRHGSLKKSIDQALLLRGHRDFTDIATYRCFIAEIVARMNLRVSKAFTAERSVLVSLPPRRTAEYEEVDARVTRFATFTVKKGLYSAPSRLVGYRLKIRVYLDRIEAYLGAVCVLTKPRIAVPAGKHRSQQIDYRHILPALKTKPGALARWRLRDAMFPRTEYRLMWERLIVELPERAACRLMVGLLDLAARGACEVELGQQLTECLATGALPNLAELEARLAPRTPVLPAVRIDLPSLGGYDALIPVAA